MSTQLNLFPTLNKSFKIKQIIKRSGQVVDFDPEKITNAIYRAAVQVQGKDRDRAIFLTNQVLSLTNQTYTQNTTPSVEEIQDLVEKVLIENHHARTAKAFILYREDRARVRERKDQSIPIEDNVPYKLLWKIYSWNVDHHCHTVEQLNHQIKDGGWKNLVLDSENEYSQEIQKVGERILKRKEDLRVLIIAGPSSSGKTTTTIKIGEVLNKKGTSFLTLNMDHYFKDLDKHPKDVYGDHDFEGPHALDLDLISQQLEDLLKGKKVKAPIFDFKTGKRKEGSVEMSLKKNEMILIDSLHGLHPDLTQAVPEENKFKFYIEAICQIKDAQGNFVRWTDLRMLRRMIRDNHHRNYEYLRTVGHWHYVRRSEKIHIVPFIRNADYVFNGSLPYELPVHKLFLEKEFPKIIQKYQEDPHKLDAFMRAQRVYELLQSLEPFPDLDFIPHNSHLREFIGGGIYKY